MSFRLRVFSFSKMAGVDATPAGEQYNDGGDITCPVCFELITEPVVFPCRHEVCQHCFYENLRAANFHCPICRQRISSWARRRADDPVDKERKKELASARLRRDGTREHSKFVRKIADVGEIHADYIKEVRMVEEERKLEADLGKAEALRLAEMEGITSEQIEKDREYAAGLAKRIEQEEVTRREQEILDRKYAEQLGSSSTMHRNTAKVPKTPSGKAKKVTAKSKGQLPISLWCTQKEVNPNLPQDSDQIQNDYKLALKMQRQ